MGNIKHDFRILVRGKVSKVLYSRKEKNSLVFAIILQRLFRILLKNECKNIPKTIKNVLNFTKNPEKSVKIKKLKSNLNISDQVYKFKFKFKFK